MLISYTDGGRCRLQPVTLDDTAVMIADATEAAATVELDAAGPEVFTFAEYVRLLGRACGRTPAIVSCPNWLALGALRLLQPVLRDIVLTREELAGLQNELLLSRSPGLGRSSVTDWLMANGAAPGHRYVNDLRRHFGADRTRPVSGEARDAAGG